MSGPAHRNALAVGTLLHWYRIERVLGQGGFGITYLATDTNLEHLVAIKEYLPGELAVRDGDASVHPVSDERAHDYRWGLERFLAEARTLAQFKHPNIVRVHAVFSENNTAYMVMEYEQGESLAAVLKAHGTIGEEHLRALTAPLLDGLEKVHATGFIHRDIKPSNIYLRGDGTPVLLDFGAARQALGQETRTLTAMVSPGYAPFEQYASADRQGPWTDIYGLGATLYRAVTGTPPADAMSRSEALLHAGRDCYTPCVEAAAGRYDERWLAAIDQALAFRPADRPPDVATWREALGLPAPEAADTVPLTGAPAAGAAGNGGSVPATAVSEAPTEVAAAAGGGAGASATPTVAVSGGSAAEGTASPVGDTAVAEAIDIAPTAAPPRWRRRALRPKATAVRRLGWWATGLLAVVVVLALLNSGGSPPPEAVDDGQAAVAAPTVPAGAPTPSPPAQMAAATPPAAAPPPPAPSPPRPAASPSTRVESLLAAAERDIDAFRLTTPRGRNAWEKYREVLRLDPDNAVARAGQARVADRYLALASQALVQGDAERARAYVGRGLRVDPDHAGLLALRRRLQSGGDLPPVESREVPPPAEPVTAGAGEGALGRLREVLRDDKRARKALRRLLRD